MPIPPAEATQPEAAARCDAQFPAERRLALLPPPTPRSLLSSASLIVVSQVVLGVVGVGSLPFFARNFGPVAYNDFSLFVTLLGIVAYQDFARALLVAALARRDAGADEIAALARASLFSIVTLASVIGVIVLSPASALALVIATLFFGLSSRDFAAMSAAGRVAEASATRNFVHAFAFAVAAAISSITVHPLATTAPFVLAQFGLFLAYRRWERRDPPTRAAHGGSWLARLSGLGTLRASPSWPRFKRDMLDLLAFNSMASFLFSIDRLLLARFAGDAAAGAYNAQNDLALKLNILSSALAGVLLPMLARTAAAEGEDEAAQRLVRIATWSVPAAFALIATLIVFQRTVIDVVLGAGFAAGARQYAWLLCGVFVQFIGFLVTVGQRARGDFTTQRRVYSRTALVTLGSAAVLIPNWGADGAVATFLIARSADAQLFAIEVSRLRSALLPRWKPALAVAMAMVLIALVILDSRG